MPDFNQSDIQQIASLVASQVVEQLKTAGFLTRDGELAANQPQQGLTASQRASQQQQAYDNEHNTNANKTQAQQEATNATNANKNAQQGGRSTR